MPDSSRASSIEKILSPNDTGETASHQAGLLIPKDETILSFFPTLDGDDLNPRSHLVFTGPNQQRWTLAFIFYNNRRFGGTRDEYRLTRTTQLMRATGLRAGDTIRFHRDVLGSYSFEYVRTTREANARPGKLVLTGEWRVVEMERDSKR